MHELTYDEIQRYVDDKYPQLKLKVLGSRKQPHIVFSIFANSRWHVELHHNESIGILEDRIIRALKEAKKLIERSLQDLEGEENEKTVD